MDWGWDQELVKIYVDSEVKVALNSRATINVFDENFNSVRFTNSNGVRVINCQEGYYYLRIRYTGNDEETTFSWSIVE